MVWAAIGFDYKCPIHFFESTVDSDVYIEMLAIHFFPDVETRFGTDFIFIQDNAPPHRALVTKAYLFYKQCTTLEWLPYSPDLNVIEHCWNLLSRRVYVKKASYSTVAELKDAIVTAWETISLEEINALVLSMRSRLRETIKVDGDHTHY
jgi:transposase